VREFVCDELPAAVRIRLIFAGGKHDILTNRIGMSTNGSGRVIRLRPRVYPHLAEIMPEPRFHIASRRCVQRLAGRIQNAMHARRHVCHFPGIGRAALKMLLLLAAFLAFATAYG
jgi:hypothetical protein